MGYLLWIFGFTGAHRFYCGKPITGINYLFTGGFFLIDLLYGFWTLNSQISGLTSGSAFGRRTSMVRATGFSWIHLESKALK